MQKTATVSNSAYQDAFEQRAMQQEMVLIDIPVPLYKYRIALQMDTQMSDNPDDDIVLAYATALSLDELVLFYTQEMERLGWSMLKKFKKLYECLLIFCTPTRLCVVMLQPHVEGSDQLHKIVLHIGCIFANDQRWHIAPDEHSEYVLVQDDLW